MAAQQPICPLEEAMQLDPQMLEDFEILDLLCIDDLNLIAGNPVWEESFSTVLIK